MSDKKPPILKQNTDKGLLKAIDFVKAYNKTSSKNAFEKAILCFSPFAAKALKIRYGAKSCFHLGACWDYYPQHKAFVVSQFGVGAPAGVLQLEYLKALRALNASACYGRSNKKLSKNKPPFAVFSLGSASGFSKNLDLGQALLIERAFYAEKDPLRYRLKLPERQSAFVPRSPTDCFQGQHDFVSKERAKKGAAKNHKANQAIQEADKIIKQTIQKLGLKAVASVTCDIPYRIQKEDLLFWKSQGAEVLEMESAGLISAGRGLRAPVYCFCVVSDFLDENKGWDKGFSKKTVRKNLLSLLEKLLFF